MRTTSPPNYAKLWLLVRAGGLLCAALLCAWVLPNRLFAQDKPVGGCATPAHAAHLLALHPDLQAEYLAAQAQMDSVLQLLNNQNYKTGQVLTVPVVFHVLYNNYLENIPDEYLLEQLAVLNEDYRRLNADTALTPASFKAVAADVEIQFCLARVDPAGFPTNGITRTETFITRFTQQMREIYSTLHGGRDAWDPSRYLNIWVCDLSADLIGFATQPGAAPLAESGVVIDYQYIGRGAKSAGANSLGRTCTHEVGHFFNLKHIWGDAPGCTADDGIADTPLQDRETYGCPSQRASCGAPNMFMNFMDYTNDACMNLFTQGQKAVMLAALLGPRSGLVNNGLAACDTTPFEPPVPQPLELTVSPNPAVAPCELSIRQAPYLPLFVQAFNAFGQMTWQTTSRSATEHSIMLPTDRWPSGIYQLVVLLDNDERLGSIRIVVQN